MPGGLQRERAGFGRVRRRFGACTALQCPQRAADVAVEPCAVAAEGLQALQAGLGDDLLGVGGSQRGELEPAQPPLAPQGSHQLGSPVALEGIARAPVGRDRALEQSQLLTVLAGQQAEIAAAQAVADAVPGGTGLAGGGDGAARAAPLAREAAAWAGDGSRA